MRYSFILFALAFASVVSSCNNDEKKNDTANIDSLTAVKKDDAITISPAGHDTAIPANGVYEKKFKNGQVSMRGEMRNGKREGAWFSYYEDGKPWSQGEYKDGLRNGKSVSWYPDGKVRYEGMYTDDKQSGVWKYYTEDGKLEKEVNYDQPTAK